MGLPKNTYDVIVVGGGASGMMAAITAAKRGKRVLLIEKNKHLGEKLRISGGGRCNILNAEEDTRKLLSNFGEADKFLFSPFSQFGMKESREFFESNGLPIMVEENNRAFPVSEKAEDVCAFFEEQLRIHKVEVRKKLEVIELVKRSGRITRVRAGDQEFAAESIILATGGISHPETGSTGEGFKWLEDLGHEVYEPKPTIVPLKVLEKWIRNLSGNSLPDAKITFALGKENKFSKRGRILFTHFGLSGPTILNSAGAVQDLLHEGIVNAYIDLFPDLNLGEVDELVQKVFEENKNKNVRNVFKGILPPGTADVLATRFPKIDEEMKVHSVTKEQRKGIVEFLKKVPLVISGLMDAERAVVADGGVPLTEVDMKTMRSTVIKNLFITGDLFNITRPTGGYSLQLCWTTGYVAGMNA